MPQTRVFFLLSNEISCFVSQAEKLFSEALRLSEKKIGKDSPYTVACLHNLGNFYQAWEKYDKGKHS
jgi:hypothetical protein